MAFGQDLEQQLGALPGKRHIAQLIENEEPVAGIALDQPAESFSFFGFDEFIHQAAAGNEAGGETLPAGSHAQARSQMRLAGAAFAQEDDVAMLGEILSRLQVPNEPGV